MRGGCGIPMIWLGVGNGRLSCHAPLKNQRHSFAGKQPYAFGGEWKERPSPVRFSYRERKLETSFGNFIGAILSTIRVFAAK